jgi:hypothetical protein
MMQDRAFSRIGKGRFPLKLRRASMFNMLLVGLLLISLMVLQSGAQVSSADLLGRVSDADGAVLVGATVTAVNLDTNETHVVVTQGSGDFVFNSLPIGRYSLKVDAKGFKSFAVPAVKLAAGDRTRVDSTLQAGSQIEVVTVTGETPELQTDSSAVGSVVTDQTVQELPLNGRNYIELVQVQPGVNSGPPGGLASGTRPDDRRQASSFSANGQEDVLNDQLIDGMDNNERYQGFLGIRPSIDAIAEVSVLTNDYTAEVGRSAGAVVNVITKSGTNNFHGTLYEFLRNDITDANDYFANLGGTPRQGYHRNQFGGSIGGPIIRNKTFFFFDIEELRLSAQSPTGLQTVPTNFEQASFAKGIADFSDQGGPTITNPDPIALKYLQLYPAANAPSSTPGTGAYSGALSTTQFNKTIDGRVDQILGVNDSLFGRYSYNPVDTFTPGPLPVKNGLLPGGVYTYAGISHETAQGFQMNYKHTFTQNLLLELRTGYTRINISANDGNTGQNLSATWGIPNVNVNALTSGLMPISPGVYGSLGDSAYLPILNCNNTFQWAGDAINNRGAHTLKAGAALIRRQLNYEQNPFGLGYFSYNGPGGSAPPYSALVQMLQGQPASQIQRQNQYSTQYLREWEPSFFAQDDWRLSRMLTLNLGVRYDVFSPFTEKFNQYSNFDVTTLSMILGSTSRSIGVKTDYGDFAPRVGFALTLPHNTVARGGFGISYYPGDVNTSINIYNMPFDPPAITCIPGSSSVPCPAGTGTLALGPPAPTLGSATNLSGGLIAKQLNYRASYIEQFNLLVEKQIGANVFTAGYVGELGFRQLIKPNLELPAPSTTAQQNPLVFKAQFPNVSSITYFKNEGNSDYHALQLAFERRFKNGFSANSNYTYGRSLNNSIDAGQGENTTNLLPNNPRYDHGNTSIDVRHRIAVSALYQIPFGNSLHGVAGGFLKGWQVTSLGFWQSGLPFTVQDKVFSSKSIGSPTNIASITVDRPNKIPGQSFSIAHPNRLQAFNTAAFATQQLGVPGNEGRNQLRGPHLRQVNLGVDKEFALWEAMKLQFRAECFNISNTENFSLPNSTFKSLVPGTGDPANGSLPAGLNGGISTTGSGFGTIGSTASGFLPRQFQFALKLTY